MLSIVKTSLQRAAPRGPLTRGFFSIEDVMARRLQEQERQPTPSRAPTARTARLSPVMHHAGRKEPTVSVARVVGRHFMAVTRQLSFRKAEPIALSEPAKRSKKPEEAR